MVSTCAPPPVQPPEVIPSSFNPLVFFFLPGLAVSFTAPLEEIG
jgi:hypothetical protein